MCLLYNVSEEDVFVFYLNRTVINGHGPLGQIEPVIICPLKH